MWTLKILVFEISVELLFVGQIFYGFFLETWWENSKHSREGEENTWEKTCSVCSRDFFVPEY